MRFSFILLLGCSLSVFVLARSEGKDWYVTQDFFFTHTFISILEEDIEPYLTYLHSIQAEKGLYTISFYEPDLVAVVRPITSELELNIIFVAECSGETFGNISTMDIVGPFLFEGFDGICTGLVDIVVLEEPDLLPDIHLFDFNGREYELSTTARIEKTAYENGNAFFDATEVRICFKDIESGISQELAYIPQLQYTSPKVLFIGDLDGDGLPDLILQEDDFYETFTVVLYLSSYAIPGDLVKRVTESSRSTGC